MNLVIITNSYPFGTQEAFLEEEMRVLEKYFSNIHIYTLAEPGEQLTRYLPENAEIYMVKNSNREIDRKIKTLIHTVSLKCLREYLFARKQFRYKGIRRAYQLIANCYTYCELFLTPMLERENTAETVFYSYWFAYQAYALACFKRKHPNAFIISRAHRYDNFIDQGNSYFRRECINYFNKVYPISKKGKQEIIEKMLPFSNRDSIPVETSHLGVTISGICNPEKKSKTINLVSCSFIWQIKRLDIIIDALEMKKDIKIHWVHFGSGVLETEIKEIADKKLSHKANVSYCFMGQTDHDDIIQYYKNNHVDLFVNSSDHEGIPVSMMEAMAAGIPCVARNVGGNSELIDDKINGFLLTEHSGAKEYSEVFSSVYHMNLPLYSAMREHAREKVEQEFASPNVFYQFTDDILQNFMNRKE